MGSNQGGIFHITVGAAPDGRIDINHELRLLKAALLYADRVKLCSITTSMLVAFAPLGVMSEEQTILILKEVIPVWNADRSDNLLVLIENYQRLQRKKIRSRNELLEMGKFKRIIKQCRIDLAEEVENLLLEAGGKGLASAFQTGMVELEFLDVTSGDLVGGFFNSIKSALLSGTTYPLLDDKTGNLVKAAIDAGVIDISTASSARTKQVALSTGLLERLPVFDQASVDEIIDIRSELSNPLIRFRSAIIEFSREIELQAWDRDFTLEVESVFRRKVEPAILDIEELVKLNKPMQKIIKAFADKPLMVPATSGLGLLLSQASELPTILSAIAGASVVAYDGFREWQEKNAEIGRNQLFFYYRAGKMLKALD